MIPKLPAALITQTIDKTTNNIVMVMFGILIGFLFVIIILMKKQQHTKKEKQVIAKKNQLIATFVLYLLIVLFLVIIWASPVYLDFPIFLATLGVVIIINYLIFIFSKTGKLMVEKRTFWDVDEMEILGHEKK